jgi:hypothetical protein
MITVQGWSGQKGMRTYLKNKLKQKRARAGDSQMIEDK